ncbi:MAG: hypothetical protein WB615_15265 [Candidatus Tumulicola sp.]
MVRSSVIRAAAWAALLSISAATLPIAATADSGTGATEYHYSTTITTVYGSQYPIAGHLDLEIFPSGILRGYYHNAFQKAFIQVVGGRDGNYIWFDIGPSPVDLGLGIGTGERLHIIANMDSDGTFKGQAFPQYVSSFNAVNVTTDSARPTTNASSLISPTDQPTAVEQYIFAAKPTEASPEDYQPSPAP